MKNGRYEVGDTVIISNNGINQVGVVTATFMRKDVYYYDVYTEHGSRFYRIGTSSDRKLIFIDKKLTKKVIDKITPTIKTWESDPIEEDSYMTEEE